MFELRHALLISSNCMRDMSVSVECLPKERKRERERKKERERERMKEKDSEHLKKKKIVDVVV